MKPLVTALGICVLFIVPAGAYGAAASYTWTGATSEAWGSGGNWTGGDAGDFPGEDDAGDTATSSDPDDPNVVVSSTVTYDVDWVVVDADANGTGATSCDLLLKIDTSGDLDVNNPSNSAYIRLIAGSHTSGSVYADDATLWHAAGTLRVNDIDLRGGYYDTDYGDRGKAVLDLDVASAPTSTLTITDDVYTSGDVDIDVNTGLVVSVDALYVGSSSDEANTYKIGAGTLSVDALIIRGSSLGNSYLRVTNGDVAVD